MTCRSHEMSSRLHGDNHYTIRSITKQNSLISVTRRELHRMSSLSLFQSNPMTQYSFINDSAVIPFFFNSLCSFLASVISVIEPMSSPINYIIMAIHALSGDNQNFLQITLGTSFQRA